MGKIKIEVDLKEYMDEHFIEIKEGLKTLNGDVKENTKWRIKSKVYVSILGIVGTAGLVFMVKFALKKLLGG